ncbi:MAG: hypothetical protein QOD82_4303, partial [Pseudonocardiales bacterium]|nr:hypothetical protein [Pseudonocardiales bacterium]
MQPTGLTSAATSGPAVLELAEASRWRAPEVTAALAEHAARMARDSGDEATALLAEGWLVQGLAAIGHGVAAVPRAVTALTEATRLNQPAASDRLRVALAGVARSLDDRSAGLVLLAPVLDRAGTSAKVRADAHLEAVLCHDKAADGGAASSVDVARTALRQVGGEYGELGLAALDGALAGQQRALRQLTGALEHARAGLHRVLGDRPASGALQPVSPYLAATLGLELTLALLDQGQHDAAREAAGPVLRWDVQPGSLVPTARLRLALAQRVYLPAGAREEALAAAEWVAKAVEQRELPEIEVESHGLLAELRERGGELSGALAASRQAHAAYRALASGVERAVVLLVRAASEVSPSARPSVEAPWGDNRAPAPAGHSGSPRAEIAAPDRPGQVQRGPGYAAATNGDTPPWLTSAGPAWRPSVDTVRHPGSVTPRRPDPESPARPGQGLSAGSGDNLFRLFEGSAARGNGSAAVPPSELREPRDPSDPTASSTQPGPLDPVPEDYPSTTAPTVGQSPRGPHDGPRDSLETTDPLLGQTIAAQLRRLAPGFGLGDGADARPADGSRPVTSPDPLFDADPLAGSSSPNSFGDSLSSDPLGVSSDTSDPLGVAGSSRSPDPLVDPLPLITGQPNSADALSGPGPLTSPDLLGGLAKPEESGMRGGSGVSDPGDPIGASGVPTGLTVAQLAIELLGLSTQSGLPPHLVLIDIATPDGAASGPAVGALASRIGSRVRDQLPRGGRIYLLEQDAVAIALPEADPQVVTRWVRTVSTGLSLRWSDLAIDMPRAVFRVDVRQLEEGRTIAEQLWDLRVGHDSPGAGPGQPAAPSVAEPPGTDQVSALSGRHLAGAGTPAPLSTDKVPNRITAQPGSGGRRRRPDGAPGSGGPRAIGQLAPRRQDSPPGSSANGSSTFRHQDTPGAVPAHWSGGRGPGQPTAQLTVQPDIGGQPIGRLAAMPVDVGRLTGQFAARPGGLAQSTGQLTAERGVGGLSTGQLTAERGVGGLSTGQLTALRGVDGQPDRQRATQAGVNGQSATQ